MEGGVQYGGGVSIWGGSQCRSRAPKRGTCRPPNLWSSSPQTTVLQPPNLWSSSPITTPLHPTAPPSAPRSIVAHRNGSSVLLEWSEPRDGGGRPDTTYGVECRACPERDPRERCGSCAHLSFRPGSVGLSQRSVTVVGLRPYITYTFTVTARNGVSHLSPIAEPGEEVNVTTTRDGELPHNCPINPIGTPEPPWGPINPIGTP